MLNIAGFVLNCPNAAHYVHEILVNTDASASSIVEAHTMAMPMYGKRFKTEPFANRMGSR